MSSFIACENVSLSFPLSGNSSQKPAISGLHFSLRAGDRLGLLGANGAGKSTMLRLLAGIYPPTQGCINSQGSIGLIANLSASLVLELSGYQNIRLLMSFWNISPRQEQDVLDDVLTFSDLEDYLDKPVSTYSTGMRMRLAFTLATFHKPDILLIDEVIGVGDAAFMKQSKARITTLNESNILVLASHSPDILLSFCTLGAVVDNGEILFFGDIQKALAYET